MNSRIKELRKELSLTQQEFADKLNISRNYVAQIEIGTKVPSTRTIQDICRKFKVNYDWLANGDGEMFQDDGDAQAIVNEVMSGDNEFAKKVLVKFARLSEERWKQLQEILTELENN